MMKLILLAGLGYVNGQDDGEGMTCTKTADCEFNAVYASWEEEGSPGPEPKEGEIQCADMHLEASVADGADADLSEKYKKCIV